MIAQTLASPQGAACALLLVAALLGGCGGEALVDLSAGPINVVLIGLDTVRADHLGCYGNVEVQTPNLDAFASESVLFENCSSTSSWTLPAFASLFTGRMPFDHGAVGGEYRNLSADLPTMAEIFGEHGYATKAYVAVDWLAPPFGLHRGFDDLRTELSGATSGRHRRYQRDLLEFLMRRPVEPHLLFAHYFDAHAPYEPPPPFEGMYYQGNRYRRDETSLRVIYDKERNRLQREPSQRYGWLAGVTDIQWPIKQYAADITHLDHAVGATLDSLRSSGLIERSIVIVVADHGEHLTEHDLYFTHRFPYQETLHVPLMIRLPGARQGGRRVSEEVSLVDLLPTLVELLQLKTQAVLEGESLAPLMAGAGGDRDRILFAEYGGNEENHVRAAWDEEFRLIHFSVEGERWDELYERRKDREERVESADRFPGERRRLASALAARFGPPDQILAKFPASSGEEPDPEALERLRALGYIE